MSSPQERDPQLSLPPHESIVSETAILEVIQEVIDAKRVFANTVRLVVGSSEVVEKRDPVSSFPTVQAGVGDIDAILRGPLYQVERANGMVFALDHLAPIADGSSWEQYTDQAAEIPSVE